MKRLAAFLILLTLLAPAQAGDITLGIGTHVIRAEVAATPAARRLGLMHRKALCANCGMLFVYETPARDGFWMKNTLLPLSIAFIDADGRIINIAEMQPATLELHYPQGDAQYVLEMGGGWFRARGIRPGDRVQGLPRAAISAGGAPK
jgi:uncharacterized membrane protein (UPF0127 family)